MGAGKTEDTSAQLYMMYETGCKYQHTVNILTKRTFKNDEEYNNIKRYPEYRKRDEQILY
jgi:hypothetical protein